MLNDSPSHQPISGRSRIRNQVCMTCDVGVCPCQCIISSEMGPDTMLQRQAGQNSKGVQRRKEEDLRTSPSISRNHYVTWCVISTLLTLVPLI